MSFDTSERKVVRTFNDGFSGVRVRLYSEKAASVIPGRPKGKAVAIQLEPGKWTTLEELRYECPCCGAEKEVAP